MRLRGWSGVLLASGMALAAAATALWLFWRAFWPEEVLA